MPEKAANNRSAGIDRLFATPGARADRWRNLTELAESWAKDSGSRAKFDAALADMAATEAFHAYPGAQLLAVLRNSATNDDPQATASREE